MYFVITNFSIPRFMSNNFERGLGFQLRYELTNITEWSYNFGGCEGSFSTPNGILTSPSHPDNYPDNSNCISTISRPTGTVILLRFLSMDVFPPYPWETSCLGDYLEIRDGSSEDSPLMDKLCSNDSTENPGLIQSSQHQVWMK